jgi:hypothetical protein
MIKYWFHKSTTKTGICTLLEHIDNSIRIYEVDIDGINPSDTNYFIFNWETGTPLNLVKNTNTNSFYDLIRKLNSYGFYFIADFTTEATHINYSYNIDLLNKLAELGVDLDNKFILAQNDSYNPYMHKIQYGSHRINKTYFPHFLISTPLYLSKYVDDYNSVSADVDFLCLNRRMSLHKLELLSKLWERGLLDSTNFTWVNNNFNLKLVKHKFPIIDYLNIDVDNFKSIQLDNDIHYGSELANMDEFLYTINPLWYHKSRVNIISETSVIQNIIHITEKTFKAIYLEKPFVIYADKGYLSFLRELGFKTFNSIVNENYDDMNAGDVKMNSLIDAAVELSKVYNTDEVKSICKWNKSILIDINHSKNIVEKYFLKYLNKRVI